VLISFTSPPGLRTEGPSYGPGGPEAYLKKLIKKDLGDLFENLLEDEESLSDYRLNFPEEPSASGSEGTDPPDRRARVSKKS